MVGVDSWNLAQAGYSLNFNLIKYISEPNK